MKDFLLLGGSKNNVSRLDVETGYETPMESGMNEYTVKQTAKILDRSESAVRSYIQMGRLKAEKKDGRYVISEKAITDYLQYAWFHGPLYTWTQANF